MKAGPTLYSLSMFWRWSVFESDFIKQTKNSEKDGLKGNLKGKFCLHWFIKIGLLITPKNFQM